MAKWGEGDPRWIVEERPDATNVNNWHWTEKDASAWSNSKLHSLFVGLVVEDDKIGRAEITKMEKCEGEASVNNRKGKLIFFYEWKLKMAWKGKLYGNDEEYEGVFRVPNLSEENTGEDLDVTASSTGTNKSDLLLTMIRRVGCPLVRNKLAEYLSALKTEYSTGVILPSKVDSNSSTTQTKASTKSAVHTVDSLSRLELNSAPTTDSTSPSSRLQTGTVTDTQQFKCTADELFSALTTSYLMQAFTGAPAEVTAAEPGGSFSLLAGNVTGTFLLLERGDRMRQRLEFSWRQRSWPTGQDSHCVIEIHQGSDNTELKLTQTGVPSSMLDNTKQGWRRYYWEAMRRTLGFGVPLLESM